MASQISPGVVIKERDLTAGTVVNSSAVTAAVVSTFQKGPINEVITISSQRELIETFGSPGDSNADDFFVASEFLNYGGRLSVVRAKTGAVNAGAAAIIENGTDYSSRIKGSNPAWKFAAKTAGTHGNALDVVVADRGADQYITFSSVPAGMVAGTNLTFSSGKTAEVLSWNSSDYTAAVILDDPSTLLTTTDTLDTPDTGVATTLAVTTGGTGYKSATGLSTTGGNGSGLSVNITVSTGTVNALGGITAGGSGYAATGTGAATTSTGSGTGLTVDFTATGGVVDSVAINTAGDANYAEGDVITISGAGANATFTIPSGGVTGPITGVVNAGGGTLYQANDVVTVTQSGGATGTLTIGAVQDTSIAITEAYDWWTNTNIDGAESSAGSGETRLSAIGPRPGTSAYAADKGVYYDEVHIAVVDRDGSVSGSKGSIVERMTFLSKLTDGKNGEGGSAYYVDQLELLSDFIYAGSAVTQAHAPSTTQAGTAWGSASPTSGTMWMKLSGVVKTTLTGGTDDYEYTNGEFESGLDLFSDKESTDIDFILMGGGIPGGTEANAKTKAAYCATIAGLRKDAIAFLSAYKENQVSGTVTLSRAQQKTNTIAFFSAISSSSYTVLDSGFKYFYDRFNDKYRYIPCNGDVAGLCVSTSATLDDWFSPAGLSRGGVRNAIKLAFNPTAADRDELYQARINPIVSFPGQGITLFGDKTALSSPSAFDRINVRRLFINIEKRAESLAKGVLFEQNDETTRLGFTNALSSYLTEVQARRGITDYLVVCDESNNTASVIDRNEFVAEVFVKPTRSINYITLSFVATRSGVAFSEVVGQA